MTDDDLTSDVHDGADLLDPPDREPVMPFAVTVLTQVLEFFDERSNLAAASLNLIITRTTLTYLDSLDPADPPSATLLEQHLLTLTNEVILKENLKIDDKISRYARIKTLTHWQTAQILLRLHHIVRIAPINQNTDREYDLLGMYRAEGSRRGTYTTSEDDIRTMARRYNTQLTLNEFKEILAILREDSPRVHKCTHRDLIAVNNGIVFYAQEPADITIGDKQFHFEPKDIHPFDPAIVFTTKSAIDYDPDGGSRVVISHPDRPDWEVGDWIEELSEDEGVPALLWEILGAIVRPHVRWNKTAWFYSTRGNNGKGTLCSLARNLVGDGAHTSIPLSDFGKNFALEPLISSTAIIVDENDVGAYIDQAANLKAVVTGDVIQIDRKHRMPVAFQFSGFMIQCLNDLPRARDKSDSFYRRQLFVPFTKWFGGGNEKRWIKDDYLRRQEVLEYVLWYVINRAGATSPGNFYELSEPPATRAVLAEYKEVNDPVRSFWEEFRERFVWDLLPMEFLYTLHKAWFAEVSPSGSILSQLKFAEDLRNVVRDDELFFPVDKTKKMRPGQRMRLPEPLIDQYNLTRFYNPNYAGANRMTRCTTQPEASYRGPLMRRSAMGTGAGGEPVRPDPSDPSSTADAEAA